MNTICCNFSSFIAMRHIFDHFSILFKLFCRIVVAIIGSGFLAGIAGSSAKVEKIIYRLVGRSAVKMRYNMGPSTLP